MVVFDIPMTRRAALVCVAMGAAAVCSFALSGCASQGADDVRTAITAGIDADMAKLTSLDETSAQALFPTDFTQQLSNAGVDPSTVYAPLFDSLSYEITGIDVASGDREATAHLSVTSKDVQTALENYTASLTDDLVQQQDASVTRDGYLVRMAELLTEALEDENLSSVTTSVDVTYDLTDGKWVARDTADLRRAILGGMSPEALSAALNEQ